LAVDLATPILVVDDYSTMRRILRNLLKQLGFENVDEAPDGPEAISLMHKRKYGLVISDWNMEPMTGLDLLRTVRSDERLARTPFMLVTAAEKPEFEERAKAARVSSYLVKPFTVHTLKAHIENIVGK
jgi:two-component system chemotaxis response regulator CheY